MAEAILKHKNLPNISVKSAGLYAMDGGEMSPHAQTVLAAENISHQHTSKQLKEEDIAWADVILTMTRAHKQMIIDAFNGAEGKTFTLKEYVSAIDGDVSDPFGGTIHTYSATFEQLRQLIDALPLERGLADEKKF